MIAESRRAPLVTISLNEAVSSSLEAMQKGGDYEIDRSKIFVFLFDPRALKIQGERGKL